MKFEKIKPSDVKSDPSYQRELDEKRSQDLATTYNGDFAGVPVVSRRNDGQLFVLDGQHRISANVSAGMGSVAVLMQVHDGLSIKQEADMFHHLNKNRRAVGAHDDFKARVKAEHADALAVVAILKSHGLKITHQMQKNGVRAIQAVESVYRRGNLSETMHILAAWSAGDPSAFDGPLVKGVSSFLAMYGARVDVGNFSAKLRSHGPSRVTTKMRATIKDYDCRPSFAACNVFRGIYNAGRGKAKCLPPPETMLDAAQAIAAE